MLGWLAWGLAGPDKAEAVKQDLVLTAGDLVVAESRWSERSHARRAWRQMQEGALAMPTRLIAPYIVSIMGSMVPDDMDRMRQIQEAARSGGLPWPEQAIGNMEAFYLAAELDKATDYELRKIGRGITSAGNARAAREKRRRNRELRARLGLTDIPAPGGRCGSPAASRPPSEMYMNLIELKRSSPTLAGGAR